MRKFIVSVFAVLLFVLTACGASSGTVYDKQYHPAYDTQSQVADQNYLCQYVYGYDYTTQNYGYHNHCGYVTTGYHTVTNHHQDCWEILFKNDKGDRGHTCVGAEVYNATNIGDFFEK